MTVAVAGDPTDLIQFGVVGVILMLILFGFLWAKPAVDRLIADKERAEAQRDALVETYQKEIIPVLGLAARGTEKAVTVIEETRPILVEVRTLLRQKGAG